MPTLGNTVIYVQVVTGATSFGDGTSSKAPVAVQMVIGATSFGNGTSSKAPVVMQAAK